MADVTAALTGGFGTMAVDVLAVGILAERTVGVGCTVVVDVNTVRDVKLAAEVEGTIRGAAAAAAGAVITAVICCGVVRRVEPKLNGGIVAKPVPILTGATAAAVFVV